ncbi:MAG: hypothetical protein ACOCV4_05035 [Myxococcota bacterium]
MDFSDRERRTFARQLLLPEIGEAGQAKLCESRFAVPAGADPQAAEVARDYLVRAGVREGAGGVPVPLPEPEALRGRAPTPELRGAAAAVAGAFAAVETIKALVGAGRPGALPPDWSVGAAE